MGLISFLACRMSCDEVNKLRAWELKRTGSFATAIEMGVRVTERPSSALCGQTDDLIHIPYGLLLHCLNCMTMAPR